MTPRQRQIEEAADELITEWRNRVAIDKRVDVPEDADSRPVPLSDLVAIDKRVDDLERALLAPDSAGAQQDRLRAMAPELFEAARQMLTASRSSPVDVAGWETGWCRLVTAVEAIECKEAT